jgi:hypothetical protein
MNVYLHNVSQKKDIYNINNICILRLKQRTKPAV